MPILPPVYFVNYVNGRENFIAITYNIATMVWTITANGSQRVSIAYGGTSTLSINGNAAMFVLTDGEVYVNSITKFANANNSVPRLDFMRQAGALPRKFASLDQNGNLSCYDLNEKLAPSGTDRMYLLENGNCSLGVDGLLTAGLTEAPL